MKIQISKDLLEFISPSVDREKRLQAASASIPMSDADLITVLVVLGFGADDEVAAIARQSLESRPLSIVISAMSRTLDPWIIKRIIEVYADNEAVMLMAAINDGIDDATLEHLLITGPESVGEFFSENPERLRGKPSLVEAFAKNPGAQEFEKKELPEASVDTRGVEKPEADIADVESKGDDIPKPKPDPDRVRTREEEDTRPLSVRLLKMDMAEKMKLAFMGNKEARGVLLRDSKKIIAMSALKNPGITEDEILKLASKTDTNKDMLRQLAGSREWTKSYAIRSALAFNPKTPVALTMKFLTLLNEKDVAKISKSKNVPNAVASAARRMVLKKKRF